MLSPEDHCLARFQILPSSNGLEIPPQHSSWCHFLSFSPNSNQKVQRSVATMKQEINQSLSNCTEWGNSKTKAMTGLYGETEILYLLYVLYPFY